MRRCASLMLVVATTTLLIAGCGKPQPERRASTDERVTPVPLPTRNVAPDFATRLDEVASRFPDFDVTPVGPYWVQLTHRQELETTISVGVEPRLSGSNAEAVMDDTLQGMGGPSSSRVRETGTPCHPVPGIPLGKRGFSAWLSFR